MLTRVAGGRVIDPANGRDGIADLWFTDGRVVEAPNGREPDENYDATGAVVMAGGIDIHSHIAGAKVNTARLLLPELRGTEAEACVPVEREIGRLYAAMGFTLVVEPAVSPQSAVQAQDDLAQIPFIDTAQLTVLGNEDYLLGLLRDGEGRSALADYAGRMLAGSGALGVKVINPGGAAAFKANVRRFGLDDEVPGTGVTSRTIIRSMQEAVDALGVPHPVHLHCNNLGLSGNAETALATIAACGDERLHLAHLQFYAYGTEGLRGFSSSAPLLAEAVNSHPKVTADVGQVMFGQTVTISSDTMRQFGARGLAFPRKWAIAEGEGNGEGIVPFRYRRSNFFNAVQFAAGLELFLLIEDPWRLFFTTDHPNGAPFTAYPDLFALLMRRDLRSEWIETLPPEAIAVTTLPSIAREYEWREIAIMTRAAPARLLGLADRGHLGPGARADVAVYRPGPDLAATFRSAELVFKDGILVVREGEVVRSVWGRTLALTPAFDAAMERRLAVWHEQVYGVPHTVFDVPRDERTRFESVPCRV